MRLPAVLSALLIVLCATAARAELRVFEMRHAEAQSLLPVIENVLASGESVSVYRNSLVVNAATPSLQRIASLLDELDRPLRNLRITLRSRSTSDAGGSGGIASGTLQRGDVSVSTGSGGQYRSDDGNQVNIRAERRISTRSSAAESSVRAVEGTPVMIRDGQLVALPGGGIFGTGIQYQDVGRGMLVRARSIGETIAIDILATDDRVESGAIRSAEVESSVSARPGEWILLGGIIDTANAQSDATLSRHSTRSARDTQFEIRVDILD
jgi:hypothetical protein